MPYYVTLCVCISIDYPEGFDCFTINKQWTSIITKDYLIICFEGMYDRRITKCNCRTLITIAPQLEIGDGALHGCPISLVLLYTYEKRLRQCRQIRYRNPHLAGQNSVMTFSRQMTIRGRSSIMWHLLQPSPV